MRCFYKYFIIVFLVSAPAEAAWYHGVFSKMRSLLYTERSWTKSYFNVMIFPFRYVRNFFNTKLQDIEPDEIIPWGDEISLLDEDRYLIQDMVTVSDAHISGKVHVLKDSVQLVQLKVPQQKSDTCAYHALFNAIRLYRLHNGYPEPDTGKIDEWRRYIIEKRAVLARKQIPADGMWLDEEEMKDIISLEQQEKGILQGLDFNYSVISTPEELNAETLEIFPELNTPFNKLKRAFANNKSKYHVFIMGTMSQEQRIAGHWFSVLLATKPADQKYYITDSQGTNRLYNDVQMKALLTLLHNNELVERIKPYKLLKSQERVLNKMLDNKNKPIEETRLLYNRYLSWGGNNPKLQAKYVALEERN